MKVLSRCFQPGESPSRGLLRDCTTSPINRFAALSTYSDILWIRIIFSHGEDEGSRGDAGDQLAPVRGHLPL